MNDYFSYTGLTKFSLARAEQVNGKFESIVVGFDKLPQPDQLNEGRHTYVVAGGTANVITVSLPKAPASYVDGLHVRVKISATTTTDATINVNGLGAKAVVRADGSATAANDLVAGQIVDMVYDGSVFRLIAASEVLAAASAAAAAASAAAADASADAAAASATAADASADAAAASAAAAAATDKVAKAGDTMTGLLQITGPSEQIRLRHATPSLTGYNAAGTVRFGYLGFSSSAVDLISDSGLNIGTSGVTRLAISAAGASTFSGNVSIAVSGNISVLDLAGTPASGTTMRIQQGSVGITNAGMSIRDITNSATRFAIDGAGAISLPGAVSCGSTLAVTGAATFSSTGAFTGALTAPTAAAGTNTTQVATTAFVQSAVAALINAAPGALDTLDELAAAMGDDANFATTMTNALALKAPLASPTFTGDPKAPTPTTGDNDTSIATTAFVQATLAASPALGGNPTAPTPSAGDADTSIATTAFVDALRDLPQRSVTGSDTLVIGDRAKHVCYTGAGGHTETVPPNSSVAYPVGSTIVLVNDSSSTWAIARGASVVMRWAASGADANRTLAAGGMATLLKVGTDRWIISGAGLS